MKNKGNSVYCSANKVLSRCFGFKMVAIKTQPQMEVVTVKLLLCDLEGE